MVFSTPKNPAALKVSLASIVILASSLVESALRVIISELVSLIVSAENVIFFAVPVAASKPLIIESLITIDVATIFRFSGEVSIWFFNSTFPFAERTYVRSPSLSFVTHSKSSWLNSVEADSTRTTCSAPTPRSIFTLSTPFVRLDTSRKYSVFPVSTTSELINVSIPPPVLSI